MADDCRPTQQIESISDNPLEVFDKQDNIKLDETIDDVPCTAKQAKNIQAIDKTSVHKICSGQVVLTLATAVKELVENSIDASATSVEIKLKEFGSESIEVSDNGHGVEEMNFQGLTLKHHTSKLQDFDDLVNVTTFGFRGEALSSLCALSKMTIVTRHKTATVGTKLEFDLSGRMVSKKSAPRQVGTTVHIENIFHTLPVRHKEFQKNVKKEFAKLVQVLNAYCIINTGVRISCFNQTGKGSRSAVVTTNGNVSMRENISNVYGQKQLSSLLEFRQSEPQDEVCEDFGIKPQQKPGVKFLIEGFVSKCEHGQGRGSTDRQFIFINRRPCDSSKILKIVNEVYHSYNRHQHPFIVLSISMDKDSVDVNVTPDKRQIFVEGEPFLLAVIKTSLIQMFEPTSSVYKVNNILSPPQAVTSESSLKGDESLSDSLIGNSAEKLQLSSSESLSSSLAKLKRSFSSAFARGSTTQEVSQLKKTKNTFQSSKSQTLDKSSITHFFNKSSTKSTTGNLETKHLDSEKTDSFGDSINSLDSSITADEVFQTEHCDSFVSEVTFHHNVNNETSDITKTQTSFSNEDSDVFFSHDSNIPVFLHTPKASHASPVDYPDQATPNSGLKLSFHKLYSDCDAVSADCDTVSADSHTVSVDAQNQETSNSCVLKLQAESDSLDCESSMDTHPVLICDVDTELREDHKCLERTIPFSIAKLKRNMETLKLSDSDRNSSFSRCFRATINPADNSSAEDELSRAISKDMFSKMEILGQFNLGFIIAKLDSDLFIIDQHATDEKYNFEMLQRSTVLQSQKLLCPKTIELTASNEAILVDNLEVFKKNGFDFLVDEVAPPTQRVKLTSTPVSKNWIFGKDDIEELIFMLTDSPNVMCRPTRVRLMFASRACRKSVMIGTALSQSEMRRLVNHMGELDQPWNCPHGRPTMRHLFNMEMLPK